MLQRNETIFRTFGPDPLDGSMASTEAAAKWNQVVLDEIVPGNELIVAMVQVNPDLASPADAAAAELLRLHTQDLAAKHRGSGPVTRPAMAGGGFPVARRAAGADDGPVGDRTGQLAGFCVVANVAEETASGQGGLEVRAGVRHFAAGAKVQLLPPQWGDGGHQVIVAGYHRGTRGRRGLARMVMPRRHLTGFRVRGVYSPAVIRALTRPLTELGLDHAPRLWATRQQAADIAAAWRALPLAAHADDWSFTTAVTGPPPLQITREGRTWYLAHLNAHRAVYSPHLPPAEPPTAC